MDPKKCKHPNKVITSGFENHPNYPKVKFKRGWANEYCADCGYDHTVFLDWEPA